MTQALKSFSKAAFVQNIMNFVMKCCAVNITMEEYV